MGSNLNRKVFPKLDVPRTGPTLDGDGGSVAHPIGSKLSPEVPLTTSYKTHEGIREGLTKSLQWKEEHKGVVLRLTREGEEEGAGTPCSGLHTAPNWAQTKRLSQLYKSPNVRGSDGEQTERKKEEEEEGFRWLTQAPKSPRLKEGERGWDGPLRAPIPPQTKPQPRREAERRNKHKRGSKMEK